MLGKERHMRAINHDGQAGRPWWMSLKHAALSENTQLITALALFLGFLALRLPIRAEFLVNWDAVNYALGTNLFSLEHHQPHPPGYIGYIALGWLFNHLTGDANISFTLLSVISGAAAPTVLFLMASYFMSWRYALVTAVTFGLSPLVWYYSEVALGYSLAMAMALFFLWTGYKARAKNSPRFLYAATVFLILLGSIRQSGALFLIPLWLYLAWSFPWRYRFRAGSLLFFGNLAWLLPLIFLAGDPLAYIRASAGLAGLAVAPTSLFSLNVFGLACNLAFVAAGILVGVNAGLLIIGLGHWSRTRPLAHLRPGDKTFFLLWLGPSLATYVLVHTGQLGYILLLLPIGYLWAGMALSAMARQLRVRHLLDREKQPKIGAFHKYGIAGLITVFCLANVTGALYAPKMASALANPEKTEAIEEMAEKLLTAMPMVDVSLSKHRERIRQWTRQFNVEKNDAHWNQLIDVIEAFPPGKTAVLAISHTWGSFRHLTYYLPEYRIYGLGEDLKDEVFGHLFVARDGTSDYSIDGMEKAKSVLDLPEDIRYLLIPDKEIYKHLSEGVNRSFTALKNGTRVCVVTVRPNALLRFEQKEEEKPRIVVDSQR